MSNPFAQDGWDPFGELPTASKPQTTELPRSASEKRAAAGIRPARAAPAPPRTTANPFSQLSSNCNSTAAAAAADDNDPFGLLSSAPMPSSSTISSSTVKPTSPPPPSYESVVSVVSSSTFASSSSSSSTVEPPPPSYTSAADLPPPPAYDAASFLPPAPPSYEEVAGMPQQQQQQQQPAVIMPSRPPPPDPSARGPLHAGMPSRPAPAAPAPARPAPLAPVPARAASQAPISPARPAPPAPPAAAAAAAGSAGSGVATAGPGANQEYSRISSADLEWLSSTASAPVPALAAAGLASAPPLAERSKSQVLQRQMADLHVSAVPRSISTSSSLSSSYFSIGNVGAAARAGPYNSQQALQRELNAQLRLPPLNPKTAAPLKLLAAGLGSLFAGPVVDAAHILQWTPAESGTTLPIGGHASSKEDHDSAACAELTPHAAGAFAEFGSNGKSRVTCMALAAGPGLLWCGTADGTVHCWSLGQGGTAASWRHSWLAHNGKVKAIAVSQSGRVFTGSSSGAVKMWGYSSPIAADAGTPRLLRLLRKVDSRTGVASNPHSKVVGIAVSAGGRVLWSVGKNTISLWSTHNGEYLGTMSDSNEQQDAADAPFGRPYGSSYAPGLTAASGQAGSFREGIVPDINPKVGLDAGWLDQLFAGPAAELLADREEVESENDTAAVALNAAVKGVEKATKQLLGKFGKLAAKIKDEGRTGNGEPSGTSGATFTAAAQFGSAPSISADPGLAYKASDWGNIKKLAAAADGCMWLSYKKGLLEKYSEAGQLLWSSCTGSTGAFKPAGGITALAAVGSSIWVGDTQGNLWVLDGSTAALQRSWQAHVFPVRCIAAGGHLVYSLGKAGSIRAWPALPPPPAVTAAWQHDLAGCLQQRRLEVLVGTWNVNETKPSRAGLQMWLGQRAKSAQLVMIGLQEVEMGTGSVALDVVYQNLAKGRLEAGTQAAQAWASAVSEVLCSIGDFRRVGLRQMSGVLVLVFARAELEPHIGEVATASVACGVMGYGGNKGAVAISFSLFRRRVVMVSSHFAAHQEKVEARNADYAKIVRHLHFHNVPTDKPQQQQQYESSDVVVVAAGADSPQQQAAAVSSIQSFLSKQQQQQQQQQPGGHAGGPYGRLAGSSPPRRTAAGAAADAAAAAAGGGGLGSGVGAGGVQEEDWGAGVRDAEALVWVGDFNYRVDSPDGFVPDTSDLERWPVNDQLYLFVHKKIAARQHMDLLSGDQCIREMARGAIFHGLAEGPISFMPTYKFEKGRESNALQPFYDQGEKKRVPAWTDRVFFRGSGPQRSALQPNPAEQAADIRVALASPQAYNSLMEVNDSDHKPVFAVLNLLVPWYQQQQQRRASMGHLWQVAAAASSSSNSSSSRYSQAAEGSVSLQVEPQQLVLRGSCVASSIAVRNPSQTAPCMFAAVGPSGALPTWLEVSPAAGVIPAGDTVQLRVQGTKAQWGRGGSCELRLVGCLEGSVDSSWWPMASYGDGQAVFVELP